MTNVLISAAGLCGATIIGAISGILRQGVASQMERRRIGDRAGIMLTASTLGLIVPAFEQTRLWWLVVIGVMAGALFLNQVDPGDPHLHHITGLLPQGASQQCQAQSCDAFVMAIALHKLPEGTAAWSEASVRQKAQRSGAFPSVSPCRTSLRVW